MSPPTDRLKLLRGHPTLNGIDFIEVAESSQLVIDVHFVNPIAGLSAVVEGVTITGGDVIPEVRVTSMDWTLPAGNVLRLGVSAPGDFSTYTLKLVRAASASTAVLDPYFDHATFSFKARCPSTLDCRAEPSRCAAPAGDAPPIDYLAKDFRSFRDALFEMSRVRYGSWVERSEADFGVMFLSALASVADDLSYFQDRVAGEAHIGTATERRSVVRLARLVDYEPRPATAARVLLQIHLPRATAPTPPVDVTLSPPMVLRAQGPDGALIDFQLGTGIDDGSTGYRVRELWSDITPYWWDDADRCLGAGSTEAWLTGKDLELSPGQTLLIDTAPLVAGDPRIRALVTLSEVDASSIDPLTQADVTRVAWRAEDALTRNHDLTKTTFSANLVPATEGREVVEALSIDGSSASALRAMTRTGMNGAPQYLHTLLRAPLAWLDREDGSGLATPEIKVAGAHSWKWERSLLSAGPFEDVFTIDPMRYRPIGEPLPDGTTTMEYDGSDGATIVFGNGTFGAAPDTAEVFTIRYRVGGGAVGNVAAGTTFTFEASNPLGAMGAWATNPFPARGGRDAESDDSVRARAPHAFRRRTRRAVKAADYEAFARELPWVQRASTTFRHTGTWLAAVTAADPKGSHAATAEQETSLLERLDRVRLAGRESLVRAPRYVPLDIVVRLCAEEDALSDGVKGDVLKALSARVSESGVTGFFHPDRFTFGQRLSRRMLEAAIQRVHGVRGVIAIWYRRRNLMSGYAELGSGLDVLPWEIIQVDSNRSRPERGSVSVIVGGGK